MLLIAPGAPGLTAMSTVNLEPLMANHAETSLRAVQPQDTRLGVNMADVGNNRTLLTAVPGAPWICVRTDPVPAVGDYSTVTSYTYNGAPLPGSSAGVGTDLAARRFVWNSDGQSLGNAVSSHSPS